MQVPDIKTPYGIRRQKGKRPLRIGYAKTLGTQAAVMYQGAKRECSRIIHSKEADGKLAYQLLDEIL